MKGLGTIVNVLAVLLGSAIGLLCKGGLDKRIEEISLQTCGLATIFIGASGTLSGMFTVEHNTISTSGTLLLICSLVLGGAIGAALRIEERLEELGEHLKHLAKAQNDSSFVDGFMTATLVTCIGAMAVVGSIQDGLSGDASMLFAKSVLDFVIVIVFSASLGIGVLFSALPLGLYQGGITLFAVLLAPLLSDTLINELSFVGSALILGVGVNISCGKKFQVGNMLPALFVPVLWEAAQKLIALF